jgi:hypothetical protein
MQIYRRYDVFISMGGFLAHFTPKRENFTNFQGNDDTLSMIE